MIAASDDLTHEYPLSTAHLTKGSLITAEEIERAFGVPRSDRDYRLVVLRARKYIEWRLSERGLEVVTRSKRDDIVILTDAEAAPFTDAEFQNTIGRAGRLLYKQQAINRDALADDQRDRHDRALLVNGATYAGAKGERRKALVKYKPRERLTPGGGE